MEVSSWDPPAGGKMLIADIGQANIEEVNLGMAGANYGWRAREGTFVLGRFGEHRLFELPPFDISFRYSYPVAQYDHDEGAAIAGGFVYRGSRVPQLTGKYVFGDLVNGRVFYVDAADLELDGQPRVRELRLLRNAQRVDLLSVVGGYRVDLRFGQGEDGEIYLLTKQDGMVRTFGPRTAGNPN